MEGEIRAYIRERRATYTRAAITEQLRAAGHGEAEIEAAWAAVEADDAATARPAPAAGPSGGVVLAYIAMSIALFVCGHLLTIGLVRDFGSRGLYALPAVYLLAVLFGLWRGFATRLPTAASTGHLVGAALLVLPLIDTGIGVAHFSR